MQEATNNWNWVDSLIQALAIVIGAGVVAWQVRVQFRNNRKLQQQNAREKLWLEIYREISDLTTKLERAAIEAGAFATGALFELQIMANPEIAAPLGSFLDRRASNFSELNSSLSRSVSDITRVLERYEIIKPELKIFRTAFGAALADVRRAQHNLYLQYLVVLPMDIPEERRASHGDEPITLPPPDKERMELIDKLTTRFVDATSDIGSYAYDLGVETQNLLLGSLFEHRVPRREPIDPSLIVIATDPPKKVTDLEEHFEKNTAWGRAKQESEKRARQKTKP